MTRWLEIPAHDPETAGRLAKALTGGAVVQDLVEIRPATRADVRALLSELRAVAPKPPPRAWSIRAPG